MEDDDFDEASFFRRVAESGARAVLIGRRALIALGIPLLTADYDFWIHIDDIETFNAALEPLGLSATHSPAESRGRGRYVLENGEHVDVLVGRSVPTVDGGRVTFDEVWARRVSIDLAAGVAVVVPCLDDLEATKRESVIVRWPGVRPEDIARVRALSERRLTPDEWGAYVNQPVTAEEEQQMHELLSWFARRYPTPADRLRYARRAYRRWARGA